MSPARQTNWAGNYTYQAREIQAPGSVTEAQQIVAGADRVRTLGTRHSFNAIADSDVLITLDRLPAEIECDRAAQTVTLSAGLTYGTLATTLEREGLGLANLASLPHISVAGAIATGTRGSGDSNGSLATAVAALEFITASGEAQTVRRVMADARYTDIPRASPARRMATRQASPSRRTPSRASCARYRAARSISAATTTRTSSGWPR